MLPATIIIGFGQYLDPLAYGTNYKLQDTTFVVSTVLELLPTAGGSYLGVVGVVYGLLIAQIVNIVHEKFVSVRNALSEELASCQQVSVLIKSIATKSKLNYHHDDSFLYDRT
jgi:hypothetical protein